MYMIRFNEFASDFLDKVSFDSDDGTASDDLEKYNSWTIVVDCPEEFRDAAYAKNTGKSTCYMWYKGVQFSFGSPQQLFVYGDGSIMNNVLADSERESTIKNCYDHVESTLIGKAGSGFSID